MKLDPKELKGLHCVPRRLVSGEIRSHYYAWRGGPPLKERYGTIAFVREFERLTAGRKAAKTPQPTFQSLITQFKASTDFPKAERTQKDYNRLLDAIGAKFATLPLSAFKPSNKYQTRGIFLEWRDELAKNSPRQADYHWTVLARVCSVALNRGKIETNPCEKGGRVYKANRQEIIWENADLEKFYEQAPDHLKLPVRIAEWTGQREGDILKMKFGKGDGTQPWYDGTHIFVRQGKSNAFVKVRATRALKEALDAEWTRAQAASPEEQKKRDHHILVTERTGTPWSEDGFRSSFGKARDKVPGLKGKTFHDLRGTAITRLAEARCTTPEIAAVTGHDERYVNDILKAHYLAPTVKMAENAIDKLEVSRAAKEKEVA